MKFCFSGNTISKKDKMLQRVFEIIPGLTSWSVLLGISILSVLKPVAAAVFIIAFYLYWLLRLFYMTIFLVLSYIRLSIEKEYQWMDRVLEVDSFGADGYNVGRSGRPEGKGLRERMALAIRDMEISELQRSGFKSPLSKDILHLVIIPIAKETMEVIEPGIRSFISGTFPAKRIMIVMAQEERARPGVKKSIAEIQKKYRDSFFDMIVSRHPDGLPGEARVKGANATFAAKEAARYFEENNISFENVIVSCFDADTVVDRQYFACLTYYFMVCSNRHRASFQPIPVYNNNIWEAPGITRVLEIGSSFFQLIESTNPEKLVTFSSHSMSFKALVEIGYWPCDMISDDSAIFWKAFIHYDGDYRVVPIYTTLSMDAVVAENLWRTAKNVYKQKRRWAWGVENFPIVMRAFLKNGKMGILKKIKYAFKLFEGHIAWATWAFLLSVIGWLPAVFAGREFAHSVIYYSAPRIAGIIFNLASVSLFVSIVISQFLLPKRRIKNMAIRRIGFVLQWFLVPFILIFLSALPALDAQTRLMFGKYMTFWVTDKKKK